MWSPYYRPTGKTEDGKPIIPIDYFKQTSREVGAFKTDPNLVELGPKMLAANARLAKNIKEEVRMSGPRNKQRKDGVLLQPEAAFLLQQQDGLF
jgi:hypothetical protein